MDDTIVFVDSITTTTPSGRFVLRISPQLHATLRGAAKESGLSLNDYCARLLASGVGLAEASLGELSRRAIDQFGGALVGIVAFGSWARGEATEESDVDLLIVVDASVPLTRSLYRAWDDAPVRWQDRRVEVHIAHLPGLSKPRAGLWAEVASDGVVLFDPDHRLARRLNGVRKQIVEGALERREVHGQPYWVGAE